MGLPFLPPDLDLIPGGIEILPKAYLGLAEEPTQRLEFQFFPTEISDDTSVEYTSTPVVGRSEPYRVYSSTGARTVSFELAFYASVNAYDDGLPIHVKQKADWLRSLMYPVVSQGVVHRPPVVFLKIGDLMDGRFIVKSAPIRYAGPWDPETHLPMMISTTLQLEEVNQQPRSHLMVRGAAGVTAAENPWWSPMVTGMPLTTDVFALGSFAAGAFF